MSEALVNVSRGPLVESLHRGDAVVVSDQGKITHYIGDPYKVTYIRSAGKPLQTLNVIMSGAADKYGFSDAELSIMCASHYGEKFHRDTVRGIMNKIGEPINSLLCGKSMSISEKYAQKLIEKKVVLNETNSDCSGKHAGMIATCLHKGYDIKNYMNNSHPLQSEIIDIIAYMCEIEKENICIGVDGCGVPVHGMPIYNMALGFAKLANPNNLNKDYKDACNRVFDAMNNHPEMLAGTNGFCSELTEYTNNKLVGKLGAEGIYCIGFKEKNIGLAIKIEDGDYDRALWPTVMRCLEDLKILNKIELQRLKRFKESPNTNIHGDIVGRFYPDFHLKNI